ncbi:hypothetical protein CBER1_00144 [Cercospora berteroae]|uniref:Uncharacterized protein n=1 Tax=Cercospora berteroae TaxID=357750 RepID=A0A2S6CD84_9PEZI|nr:hypothetical protein CBER1_00144 [Cercospora berteroae]
MTHGHTNGVANGHNGSQQFADDKHLDRAKEAEDLLTAVQKLVVNFIQEADNDAKEDSSLQNKNQPKKSALLTTQHSPSHLQKILSPTLPTQGLGCDGLLSTAQEVLANSVNTWHQGFLDKLYSTNTPVGLASDLLLSALNTNSHVYAVSPALTLIEKTTAKALASLFGLTGPFAGGVSQPGGSAANSSSMVIARNNHFPETKISGNGNYRFVIFTSEHGHYSVEKAAQMFGFGSNAVRSVPVDSEGKMIPSALETAIEESIKAGETPFYINATAGTTVLGSFDIVEEISKVAKKFGLWLHVDGSWGGGIVFSETQRKSGKLKGVELADSITICAHKMLNIPVTCSFLLGKDLRQFQKGMTLPAGYLFHDSNEDDEDEDAEPNDNDEEQAEAEKDQFFDLADLTPQCGRRADSLKLYLAWTYQGTLGFQKSIDHAFSIAAHFTNLLSQKKDFSLVSRNPPPCLQVCFYFHKQDQGVEDAGRKNSRTTEKICKTLMRKGEFMVDYAPGEEGKFFRVVVNCFTRRETVERLVGRIEEVGRELGF